MATQLKSRPLAPFLFQKRIPLYLKALKFLTLSFIGGFPSAAGAQTSSQQYVYGSQPNSPTSVVSGFTKAAQTGELNPITGFPIPERFEGGLMAIDGQGKFLFILNAKSNNISMFQIDQASGALSEVPASPFQVPPTINPNLAPSQPISIATEKSGKFLFVGYFLGDIPGLSAVVSLAIDTSGLSPVLITQHSIQTNTGGAPAQLLTDPKGLHLYVGLSQGQNKLQIGGAEVYSIDPASGTLGYLGLADSPPAVGRSLALDPLDRFAFVGWGGNVGGLDSCVLSPVDGTAIQACASLQFGLNIFPDSLVAENSGKFLYVSRSDGTVTYSVDQNSGVLTSVQGPINTISFAQASAVADPLGPYIYSLAAGLGIGIHVYQVDQVSGNLAEIPGSPFNGGMTGIGGTLGLAISGNPVQAVSGPAAKIFPSTANFSATVGTSSPTQVFSIVNSGGQNLSINSISISGANASSFSETNTCGSVLAPNANCSVSINFLPASAGAFSATLQVADNAPGSPQTLALNGTGVAAVPDVSLTPALPSFPAITQGTSGTTQTLTVISSGTGPLHVSSVSLSGANASEFTFINNCTAPVAPASNCTISLVFNPIGQGQRAAILTITDDASSSPQTVSLIASANPAFTAGAAPNGSTTASVSAGQTAQYLLQLTPGAGYSGTVSFACSGAPLGAACQVPATVSIVSGGAAPFTVTISTSGGAMSPPSIPERFVLPVGIRMLLLLALALVLMKVAKNRSMFDRVLRARRLAYCSAFVGILLCSVFCAAGCGSASSTVTPSPSPPQSVVTPSGTSTITLTTSATSLSGTPLQLQPVQLTLTVK